MSSITVQAARPPGSEIKKELTLMLKKYNLMHGCSGQVTLHVTDGAVSIVELNAIMRIK